MATTEADPSTTTAMPAPDIHPTLSEDVARSDPPPSYEQVMGQFVTSVKESQAELPALSYIDIMPRMTDAGNMKENMAPTFETFSDIMVGANFWLQNNPGVKVWKCETVERKIDSGPVVHLDSTVHHESSYGVNYYVLGVRMWLTRRLHPAEPIQELALVNVVPPVKEIPLTMATNGFGFMGMGMAMGMMGQDRLGTMPVMMGFGRRGRLTVVTQGSFLTYENLDKAVENFNEVIKVEPLQGSILNVETTAVKFGDSSSGREADPDVTSWHELGKSKAGGFCTRRFTKILRVFYVKGPPKHEQLSMVSFLPKVTKQPDWTHKPQFERFDVVQTRAQQWLQTQAGIRVLNIETSDAKYTHGFNLPVTIEHQSTDDIITSLGDRNLVRFLRLFYVSSPGGDVPPYSSTVLTSRLFQPLALGGRRFETMEQTLTRVNIWLAHVGLPLFSVETVPFLLSASQTIQTDRLDYTHSSKSGNYWLTCIRLYFPQPFQEVALPGMVPGNQTSSSCSIL